MVIVEDFGTPCRVGFTSRTHLTFAFTGIAGWWDAAINGISHFTAPSAFAALGGDLLRNKWFDSEAASTVKEKKAVATPGSA